MVSLPDGEKKLKFVLTEFTNVTDGQTDRRTDGLIARQKPNHLWGRHEHLAVMGSLDDRAIVHQVRIINFLSRTHKTV